MTTNLQCRATAWFARIAAGAVFAVNIACALEFVSWPTRYTAGFELQGVPGRTMVRGLGVLFLMWNATYPPVLWRPRKHRTMMGIVLLQQLIGVVGETWLWATLPAANAALRATGARFIVFDGSGLALMGIAFGLLVACDRRTRLASSRSDRGRTTPADPARRDDRRTERPRR